MTSHLEMHREHRRWQTQNDMWRDDLANWEHEVEAALRALPTVEHILREHLDALRRHAAGIRMNEQDFSAHEHALCQYEHGETGEELIELAKGFDRSAGNISWQKEKHEKLKHRHHALMARWYLFSGASHHEANQSPHNFII